MNSFDTEREIDVLIVGAGPTGLFLGYLLSLEGIKFRIIDDNPSRVRESRALAIQARSMELFQSVGLVNKFLQRGMPATGMSLFIKGKNITNMAFSGIGRKDTPYPYIFVLSQSVTEEILEQSLSNLGVSVERQSSLIHFNQDESKVIADINKHDGPIEKVTAKYLVGCDGARSQVRKTLGLGFEGGTYDAEFLLTDVMVDWNLAHKQFYVFINDNELGVFMPLSGQEHSRIIVINKNATGTKLAEENLTTKAPASLDEIQEKFQSATQKKVTLSDPQWLSRYRVHHRSVEKMRVGQVFLAGDAAHIHSPLGGQGMNTGLQDAANLAWKLSYVLKGKATDELLDTYHTERITVAKKLLRFTDQIFSRLLALGPITKLLLSWFAPIGSKLMYFIPRYMFGFVSQLNIRYHTNVAVSASLARTSRSHLAFEGSRAPDAPLTDGSSLFELMKGYSFNILVMSKKSIPDQVRKEFELNWQERKNFEREGKIHWIDSKRSPVALKRYKVQDVLVSVVRPDGYISFQTDRL